MFKITIQTRIEIDSGPISVWEVLTGFASYPEWNPMIRNAKGELRKGARLELHFKPPGRKSHVFRPVLMVVEPERELRWKGKPEVPVLFESEHYFILEQRSDGGTIIEHGMDFCGLLIPPVRRKLEYNTREPFEAMNRALKERAERIQAGRG